MKDIIIIAVIAVIIIAAALYVYKAKKSGKKCVGCPDGGCSSCASGKGGCSCGCDNSSDKQ